MSRMLAILALVATFAWSGGAPHAPQGESLELTAIHATGSRRFREAEIVKASGLASGAAVNPQSLGSAAQRLATSGAFSKVSFRYGPAAGGVEVTFQLTDSEQFLDCRLANFIWLPERAILAELERRVPLFDGQVSTAGEMGDRIDRALEAILKQHGVIATVDHGYYQASLRAPVSAMVFKAHGPSLPVREVVFTGTRAVDAATLADTVKPLLSQEHDEVYEESFLAATTGDAYRERGYLRVAFGAPQPALLTPGSTSGPVRITVPVTDGVQYKLGAITWSGNTAFAAGELAGYLPLSPGRPVNAVKLEADLEEVTDLYATRGYLTERAQPVPSFDDGTRTVSFQIVVTEGDQYHMGALHLLGLDSDHIELLRRDCKLRMGDAFDKSYWKHFVADNASDVPGGLQNYKLDLTTVLNPTAKTVDVTIKFSPTAPAPSRNRGILQRWSSRRLSVTLCTDG
jgi:outer membrane protein assembly factor BamA